MSDEDGAGVPDKAKRPAAPPAADAAGDPTVIALRHMLTAAERVERELSLTRGDQSRKDAIRFSIQHLRDARRRAWLLHTDGAAEAPGSGGG